MSEPAANPPISGPVARSEAHWTIYLPSLTVAAIWAGVYFWTEWRDPPLLAIQAVSLAIEAVVVPVLLLHAWLRARVLRADVAGGVLNVSWGFPLKRHLRLDISGIALAQVRRSFAQRHFGGGALALIGADGERYLIPDLARAEEIAAAINNGKRKEKAA